MPSKARQARVTASDLRQNIYRLLDQVLESGEALEVVRKGAVLRIEPPKTQAVRRDLSRVRKVAEVVSGDLEDLVHMDWSAEWRP